MPLWADLTPDHGDFRHTYHVASLHQQQCYRDSSTVTNLFYTHLAMRLPLGLARFDPKPLFYGSRHKAILR